jgi:hypothetical protein
MTTTTTMTPAPTVEWKRKDFYHRGCQMYIKGFTVEGRLIGEITAIYHYKSSRLSDLVVECGEATRTIRVTPDLPARKAIALAKATLLEMA